MNKMRNSFLFVSTIALGTFLAGCHKKSDNPTPTTTTTTTTTPVKQSDQSGSSAADGAMDDVNDYINNAIGGGSTKSARLEAYNLPCGVISVDSTTDTNGKKVYTLHYGNKTKCGYKYKSGDVSFQLVNGTTFADKNAKFKITYTHYVVQALATGDIVTVNGYLLITNVTGGYVWQAVTNSATIQHQVRGTYNVTYANGATRARNYYQLRTWSSNNSWAGLTFSVAGDTTTTSDTIHVSEIGKTLDGNYYYETQMLTDFTWSNCGTNFAGPYVLKIGHARMNVTVPSITPAYFDVEAGYMYDVSNLSSTPTKVNDCTTNSYKINLVIGTTNSTEYQLY